MKNISITRKMLNGEICHETIKRTQKADMLLAKVTDYDNALRDELEGNKKALELYDKLNRILEEYYAELQNIYYVEGAKFSYGLLQELNAKEKEN